MESINKKVILLSLILAVVSTMLIYFYIKDQTKVSKEAQKTVKVYVAKKTLIAKQVIKESDIKEDSIPKERLNLKAITDKNSIIGKRLKESIIEGEQILLDRIIDEKGITLAFNVPKGKRAISINANEQVQVAGNLKQGDFVDIVASFEKEEMDIGGGVKNSYMRYAKTIIQNVQIVALGQKLTEEEKVTEELQKTVTLVVSQEDVEKVVYAADFGTIRLTLRNTDDHQITESQGTVRQDITNQKALLQIRN